LVAEVPPKPEYLLLILTDLKDLAVLREKVTCYKLKYTSQAVHG